MSAAVAFAPNRYSRVHLNTASLNYAPTKTLVGASLKGYSLHCIIFRTATDPCCGGGYLLTVLGLCNRTVVKSLTGSDVDREVLKTAQKNLSLLSADGLSGREEEIKKLFSLYGKASHRDALSSIERLRGLISEGLFTETFVADATDLAGSLRKTNRVPAYFPPDIILTDIPYGHLVEWENKQTEIETFLQSLREVAKPSTILAVCMDKKQKFQLTGFCKLSQNNIGKRKFVIFRMP